MPLREGHVKFGRYEVKTWDVPYPGRARRYDCRVCWRPFRKIMSAPYCLMEYPLRDDRQAIEQERRRTCELAREDFARRLVKRAVAAIVEAVVEANV